MKSLLEFIPLRNQAVLFYGLCRAWGLMRQYIKPAPPTPGDHEIGIAKLWAITDDHPFYQCACFHDQGYQSLKLGESTKELDEEFYQCCLRKCEDEKQ